MKLWILLAGLTLPTMGACTQGPEERVPSHESFTLASRFTKDTRVVNVYLPPGHSPAGMPGGYPTLYLPDGGMQEGFPHLAAALDAGIRAGTVRPMLLVGIENSERGRDMTGPTRVAGDRAIAPRAGGSAAFRAFLASELIPAIEARYGAGPSRGLIGESLAGLFVVETLFMQPALFDTYLALSPSLGWNDAALVKDARARMAAQPPLRGRLFLTSSNGDEAMPHVHAMRRVLRDHAPAGLYWTAAAHAEAGGASLYRTLGPQLLVDYYGAVTPQDSAGASPVRRDGEPTVETE